MPHLARKRPESSPCPQSRAIGMPAKTRSAGSRSAVALVVFKEPCSAGSTQDLACSATTVVVMPPRAENAPVIRMRRGWQHATRSSRILLVAAS